MPRDARTIAKYVVAGLALAAMLVLAPFFASGLMAPGWAVGVFIVVWLALFGPAASGSDASPCGGAPPVDCSCVLVGWHERRRCVAGLDRLTVHQISVTHLR